VPEEEMGQHACQDVVMPAWEFSNFVVVHAKLGLGFLGTLLYGPSQAAELNEHFKSRAFRLDFTSVRKNVFTSSRPSQRSPFQAKKNSPKFSFGANNSNGSVRLF
jgi:hypothetical protein